MEQWKQACLSRKTGRAEWVVLALYAVLVTVISVFHEFHFDELQSWEIARCASFRDILFTVPHYEGHPPLWHLLLTPLAKTGCDFRWALRAVNILFSLAAVAMLLFRSPFPKIVRCVLPFSYFFGYQFSVLNRPYALMALAVLLAADGFAKRNAHPWRYILPLCLLCLTTAYGIMAAGGMCIAWTIEILAELHKSKQFGAFFRSARFAALLTILALAVYLVLTLLPAEDIYFAGMLEAPSILDHMRNVNNWLMWLAMPFDTWFGAQINSDVQLTTKWGVLVEVAVSIPMMVWLCLFLKKNHKLLTFLIPYLIVSLFMILRYFAAYHLGVIAMLFLFAAWITVEEPFELPVIFRRKPELTPMLRRLIAVVACCLCAMPEVYTVIACANEIRYEYAPVSYVNFIRDNHLEDRKIMVQWTVAYDTGDETKIYFTAAHRIPMPIPPVKHHLTDISGTAVDIVAYFDRNILMNFNSTCSDDLYMHYRWQEDTEHVFALWRQQGLPEFIIGCPPIQEVYGEEALEGVRYVCIEEFETHTIFKNGYSMGNNMIFIREDLLEEYPQFTVLP